MQRSVSRSGAALLIASGIETIRHRGVRIIFFSSLQNAENRIGFEWKILLIAIAVLGFSQALGTFVSVLTFEKVVLENHTAKYGIIGKDLQRRIEQSLKFGKRLDRFVGMDELVKPLFRQAGEMSAIHVTDTEGNFFFSFRRETLSTVQPSDGELRKDPHGTAKLPFPPLQFLSDRKSPWQIAMVRDDYYILFPIKPAYGSEQGVLALTFEKKSLDRKKTALIKSAVGKLALSLGATAVLITFLVRLLIIRPLHRETEKLIREFQQAPGEHVGKTSPNRDEIEPIYAQMQMMRLRDEMAQDALGAVIRDVALQIGGREGECTALPPLQKVLGRRRHGA